MIYLPFPFLCSFPFWFPPSEFTCRIPYTRGLVYFDVVSYLRTYLLVVFDAPIILPVTAQFSKEYPCRDKDWSTVKIAREVDAVLSILT